MDCDTKQLYPEFLPGTGTYDWEVVRGVDMSASPGTVIRPDMPLGSGPARSELASLASIPLSQQEMPSGACPWIQSKKSGCSCNKSGTDAASEPPVMKCPGMISDQRTEKCPERSAWQMPDKRPERPAWQMADRCPQKPAPQMPAMRPGQKMGVSPAVSCPSMPPKPSQVSDAAECIDQFPVGMTYVPWQVWQRVFSVETAMNMGTIFPDLFKPFTKGGCR